VKKQATKYTVRDCEKEALHGCSNVNWGYAVSDGTQDIAWFRTKVAANDYKYILRMTGE
jgi:hypothetical protein